MVLLFSGSFLLTTLSFIISTIAGRYVNQYIMQEYIHSSANFEKMFLYYMSNAHLLQFISWAFLSLIFYNKQFLLAQLWYKQKETEDLITQAQKKNKELERVSQSKNKFFLSLSHEFRNPINAALGNLELASEKIFDSTVQKYINNASTSIGLLLHLVSNLLDTHKVEGGSLEWNPLFQDSRKLLNKVWRIAKNVLDKHNLVGEFYIHKKIPKLLNVDSHYMIQTLLNIILNAIKYTEQGGIMVVISWLDQTELSEDDLKPNEAFYSKFMRSFSQNKSISSSKVLNSQASTQTDESLSSGNEEWAIPMEFSTQLEQLMMKEKILKRSSVGSIEEFRCIGRHYEMLTNRYEEPSVSECEWIYEENNSGQLGHLKIEVYDSGRGIDDHLKNAIFQKYSAGEDRLGLGLGLFITKSMCESQGGRIKAFSEKDKGSQFVLTVPVESANTLGNDKCSKLKNVCSENSLEQLSAFVVDDDKYNREISSVFLSKVGVTVKGEAVNGHEAVNVITSKPSNYCDFILMDLEMPVMGGKEAVKTIRQFEAANQRVPTKIVIATGNVDLEEYTTCMDPNGEVKADLFYRKPLKKRDFEEIAEIIQRERAQQSTCIVVNGDGLLVEFIQSSLKKHKVHVISVESVEEAEDFIKEHQKSLRWVFTELNLPEEKLNKLIRVMESSSLKHQTEVIGFSENLTPKQKASCEALGIEKMLNAPLNPNEFYISLDLE